MRISRCIVLNCNNHSNQGEFVGDLCSPCHDFISEGKGINSQAYRNAMLAIERQFKKPAVIVHILQAIVKAVTTL